VTRTGCRVAWCFPLIVHQGIHIKGFAVEYSTLGRSGLRISRLCLGVMTFGAGAGIWGEIAGLDRAQATRLVAMAVERGINLIDTAATYSQGHL
jgi:aryl-alcohol dehydrogenase-like predicted oxidoreductase